MYVYNIIKNMKIDIQYKNLNILFIFLNRIWKIKYDNLRNERYCIMFDVID